MKEPDPPPVSPLQNQVEHRGEDLGGQQKAETQSLEPVDCARERESQIRLSVRMNGNLEACVLGLLRIWHPHVKSTLGPMTPSPCKTGIRWQTRSRPKGQSLDATHLLLSGPENDVCKTPDLDSLPSPRCPLPAFRSLLPEVPELVQTPSRGKGTPEVPKSQVGGGGKECSNRSGEPPPARLVGETCQAGGAGERGWMLSGDRRSSQEEEVEVLND